MKKLSILASLVITAIFALSTALCSAQDSIQYQLVIRNSAGQLITNKQVNMKFSLVSGGQSFYEETQKTTTDKFGNISVFIGTGTAVKGAMKDVPWSTMDISLKVESDTDGGEKYAELGTVPIAAAPYAMYAATAGSNANGGSPKDGEALFDVCDRDGQPVFAVYDDGIVVYVDQNSADKAKRSGLVVTGRKATKEGETADYFAVDAEGTHIYIDDADDNTKAKRSGFVVTGRKATKAGAADSKPFADDHSATKADGAEVFAINGGLTAIYVDDTDDNAKAKRSGFVVTGRKATKEGENIIDIDGSRTNLATDALSIANAANVADEGAAPVAAMQITEASVEMSSDMAMEGGVRPSLDVDKNDEYNIYLSDNEEDDPAGFDEVYNYGSYNFYTYEVTGGGYDWIASFHDDRVVPLTSQYAYMMLNGDGEETALPQDAYVVVFYHWGDINVWPLRQLDNFKVSFALTDFNKPSDAIFGGNAENYVRLNVTISSKEAYRGCRLLLGGQQVYTAKVETSQGTFNDVETGGSQEEFEVVFGETVTLAVTQVPDGQVFDSWRCNGRRYTDSVLHLPIIQMETEIYPVFKDKSPVLWVQNDFKPENPNVILDGSENAPYGTIAEAFEAIHDDDNTLRGWRINVVNADENEVIDIDESLGQKVKYITISNESDEEMQVAGMNVSADVPVVVRYFGFAPVESPTQETDEVENVITLSGRRLTLDNCKIQGGEKNRGAMVNSGELVLINTYVNFCSAGDNGDGGGAYVAEGATLSLKNESSISGNTAQNGNDVYLCGGATLNVSNSYIGEEEEKENDDVYAASESSFNVSSSLIANVNLADGAFVSANLELNGDKRTHINFSKIATPTSKVVEIKGKIDERFEHELQYFLRESFIITDQNLLENDYSQYLKFEGNIGKPFITKKIYSTGTITLMAPEQIDVYYTYYRGEDDEEYLRLKYNWDDSDYECHNYWLIGGKVCCDTIQAICGREYPIANADDLSNVFGTGYSWPEAWNNYGFERDDDYKNLLTVNTEGRSVDDDGNIIDNENEVIAELNKNVIVSCNNNDLFGSILPGFRSLIQRSICIEGRNKNLDDAQIEQWTPGNTYFGDDVNDYEIETEEDSEFPNNNYSLWDIEEHFDKLRNGYDVTIIALGGTVTDGQDNRYNGIVHLENVEYDTKLTLTAQQGENDFKGWSDGEAAIVTSRDFYIRGDVEIMPIFKQTEFTVSAGGPYKSFDLINKVIEKCGAADDVVINVNGTVKGSQTLSGNILVHSITIQGNDDDIPDVLNGNQLGRVLTINTTTPVTIENLTIIGGNGANNGGGIYCSAGSNVTLDNGTIVTGNTAKSKGGGIYVDGKPKFNDKGELVRDSDGNIVYDVVGGKLTINNGAEVSNNNVVGTNPYGDEGGSAMYINHGEVLMNGGEISNNYSHKPGYNPENQNNAYNNFGLNSRGGIRLECAKFTLKDGKITGNKSGHLGGNIFSVESQIDICGGEISNGVIGYSSTSSDACGSALFLDINSVLNMSGGKIIGNKSLAGSSKTGSGAIVVRSSMFNMSGGTISGNTIESGGTKLGSAVCVEVTSQFNISDSAYIAPDNDVSLEYVLKDGQEKRATINIVGPLDSAMVANVTVQNCIDGVQVLTLADGAKTTLVAEFGKFAITPNGQTNYAIGLDGKLKTIWQISDPDELESLFNHMNDGSINSEDIYISIESDLELNNHIPLQKAIPFKGVFDGNGHTINIKSFDAVNNNIFTLVCYDNKGIIQNVIVDGSFTKTDVDHVDASGFCHWNGGGIVRNCWNKMSFNVNVTYETGGICGKNYGLIENCINTGTIKASISVGWANVYGEAGGICGENLSCDPNGAYAEGVIKNCVNYGTVEMGTTLYNNDDLNGAAGAICGSNGQGETAPHPTIEKCYWLYECVKTGKAGTGLTTTNYMVYKHNLVRKGSATGCGYFASATNGALTAGSAEDCGSVQTITAPIVPEDFTPNLLDYLNEYVEGKSYLKAWKVDNNHAAVLDFGN